MSNALSIAAVTAILKDLLENGLVKDAIATSVGDVVVTALPPDRITQGTDERAQLNLFLYQVTQNRNPDWVSQDFRSKQPRQIVESRSTNPPLALDLHYLLTAYGAKDFQAELLLGYAMQLLHDTPVFSRELIEVSLKNAAKVNTSSVLSRALTTVSVSDVAENIGQIKISPEFFSMEDTSKLWSSLQTPYRPSAAYQASMVLIDSHNSQKTVGADIEPFLEPVIEEVTPPSESSKVLIIRGQRLQGDMTRVRLQGIEKLLEAQAFQNTHMSVLLPPNLQAGVYGVQVVHLKIPTFGMSHQEVASNIAAFVLHPTITAIANIQGEGSDSRSVEITLYFSPKVGKTQRVILLLNEVSNYVSERYSFAAATRTDDTDSITIPVENIKPGTYFVRVQVDGAESPLTKNSAGEYNEPQLIIP
jgi:methionine-rich copper-binding protein CopC